MTAVCLAALPHVGCAGDLAESYSEEDTRWDGAVAPPEADGAPMLPPDGGPPPKKDAATASGKDASTSPGKDGSAPATSPSQLAPCNKGACWSAFTLGAYCGASLVNEDFSTGKYNVHRFSLSPKTGVKADLSVNVTAGALQPAIIIRTSAGKTVYDGVNGLTSQALTVKRISTGKGSKVAKVRITAQKQVSLLVHVTGWSVIGSGFTAFPPKSVKYRLDLSHACPAPPQGALMSPPCFDVSNVVKGYYLLPQSCPSGLYKRKADACSRGTKLLIDVLYTVAFKWKQKHPTLAPINYLDLNEGSCSNVNHQTHDDGTHADLKAGCATQVSCTNNQMAIDLARLFIDTGKVCGIIFNDTSVQSVVNAYFKANHAYAPWKGKFMRSVGSHITHFHVRVKRPDGSCG